MKEYLQTTKTRKSVRKYSGTLDEGVLAELKQKLCELQPLCADIAVEYKIVPAKQTGCKLNGEYCLLVYSEEKPFWLQNAGYLMEQWDLFAEQKGVGVCWYGLAKEKDEEKRFVVMLCFGKTEEAFRTEDNQFSRRAVKDFWTGCELDEVASICRLAPSAVNSQPWVVKQTGNVLEIYQRKSMLGAISAKVSKWFNKMDMGIFLTFLETALEGYGYAFERTLVCDDGFLEKPLAKYILQAKSN